MVGWKWPLDIAIGIPWKCCRYAVVELLLLQCYHHGCNIANAGRQARPRCVFSRAIAATFLSTPKQGTVNALIVVSMYVLGFLLLCHGQLVLMQTWFLIVMIAMDSTPAACIAAPEWFWFWFGLLVLVNIATEIALTTIAAATRHLLVLVTSSGHHTIKEYNSRFKKFISEILIFYLKINRY